jgi:hypothetical protein
MLPWVCLRRLCVLAHDVVTNMNGELKKKSLSNMIVSLLLFVRDFRSFAVPALVYKFMKDFIPMGI